MTKRSSYMAHFKFKARPLNLSPEGYPLKVFALEKAGALYNQSFEPNTWAVYKEDRPVRIIGGHSDRRIRVQFYDRPDTPIRLVSAKDLDTGKVFEYKTAAMKPLNGPAILKSQMTPEQRENVAYDAFEDGWW